MIIPIISEDRSCNGCTACCDGWATGVAHGYKFYPGRKCHYVSTTGCTIYDQRPKEPCKTFKCMWLTNKTIPEWMKPNLVNAILVAEEIKGMKYVTVKETGKKLDSAVLSWVILARQEGLLGNVRYEIDGGWNFIGTPEFLSVMSGAKLPQEKQL
jgi:hypothetical protein